MSFLGEPYSNHFKGWKEIFVRMRGRHSYSLFTTGADGAPKFPLVWTDTLAAINRYTYTCLTTYESKMVLTLDGFNFMESRTISIIDQGDDESMGEYISKF